MLLFFLRRTVQQHHVRITLTGVKAECTSR